MQTWVLLHYKIPPEPTARRVYVWRKLKKLGALLLHDAVWVLPATPRTQEHFQWLATEIGEFGGDAMVWETHLVLARQEEALLRQFQDQADELYQSIVTDLERGEIDLKALSKRYQSAMTQDYFQSTLGKRVREALLAARGERVS